MNLSISMKNHLFFPLLVLQAIFMVTACSKSDDQDQFSGIANIELSNIRHDIELYSMLKEKEGENEDLRLKIAQSILRHVMFVRMANPKADSLRGEPLETICLLTEPETRKILNEAGDPQLAGLAHEYLLRIEPEVKKKIEGYQKTLMGTGCYLSPN